MIGDKSICKIISYTKEKRTFTVQEVYSQTQGYLPLSKDLLKDKTKLFDAMKQGKNIPLLCVKVMDGKPVYSSNMQALDERSKEEPLSISINFSADNEDFNSSLFDSVYNLLGDTIDNDIKYDLARQLILANRKLRIRPSLYKELFSKCNAKYGARMWKENLISYTSNSIITSLWKIGDTTERQQILDKLGISLPEPEIKEVEVYNGSVIPLFKNIANNIITKINAAKHSVKIAVAWFTNFDLFNCIKAALNRNIQVTLVTNNDLINNGGYCLNFDELIDCGLKLHLVEYPEMLHYKFCIIDDNTIITGSYNWTFYAEEINKEDVIIIEELPKVKDAFLAIFDSLLIQFNQVYKMPETVPDRPQNDRSSFKQYISEELVLRAKRNIGNRRQNLIDAQTLSPDNQNVIAAMKEFGVNTDNSSRSIAEIDYDTSQSAIAKRTQTLETLNRQHAMINQKITDIDKEKNKIIQQKEESQKQVEAQLVSANSEDERNLIRRQREENEANLNSRITQIEQEKKETEAEINTVENQINTLNSEIEIINKTSNIESKGGRGGLKITLKWNTIDDLDLHVIDPDGQEIYYGQKEHKCQDVIGRLDIDANVSTPYITTPVENIYWDGTAPIGKYCVKVNLYTKRSSQMEIPFTVTVYPEKGLPKIIPLKIIKTKEPIIVTEFDYSDNGIKYIK